MSEESLTDRHRTPLRRDQELDRRYGAIGISAVAAAALCQSMVKPQPGAKASDASARYEERDQAA